MTDKLYFVGLKAFILNQEGKLLVIEGRNMERDGLWGLPGGRIMDGEESKSLVEILKREIKEECGNLEIKIGETFTSWRFHIANKSIFLVGYECTYISGEVTLSEEHKNYRWITHDEVERLPFVDGYKEIIIDFFKKKNLLE